LILFSVVVVVVVVGGVGVGGVGVGVIINYYHLCFFFLFSSLIN
jgi:hypothetical protein